MEVIAGYKVVPAFPSHAGILSELAVASFSEAFGSVTPAADLESYLSASFNEPRMFRDLKAPGNYIFLLADHSGTAVGYSRMTDEPSPVPLGASSWLSLERIYLRASQLGKGGGDTLMAHCLGFAKEKNRQSVWLGVWQQNRRAIAFYKKWGFTIYGVKQFKLGNTLNDDYLMKKEV